MPRLDGNTASIARKALMGKALMGAALLTLAGCGGGLFSGKTAEEEAKDAAYACPHVGIVRELSEVVQFRPGSGRDQTDVVSHGVLSDYTGNCEYRDDGVTVNVNLVLVGERGPALSGSQAAYRYFVAVVPPGTETPSSKAEFDTTVDFSAGQVRAGNREELAQKIPLPKDANAKDWRLFIGFQLTDEQLAFNRAALARK